jgi:hypothetical protein
VETRQEVVSAGEEKVARCEFLCIFGRRCGRGQGQESLNAIARTLGRIAEPKTPEFVECSPRALPPSLMHRLKVRAQPVGVHS